jgi:hypothetical protein
MADQDNIKRKLGFEKGSSRVRDEVMSLVLEEHDVSGRNEKKGKNC